MKYIAKLKYNNLTLESIFKIYNWRFNTYQDKFLISKIPSIDDHILFIHSELSKSSSNWFAYFEKNSDFQFPKIIACSVLDNYSDNTSSINFGRLMVDPSFTSLGIASKLIRYSIDYAKDELKCKSIKLVVKNSNHRAIRLYERYGFELTENNELRKYILKI